MVRNRQDFFSGLLFIAVGAAFALGAGGYPIGLASNMGPGYVPRLLGILTSIVGVATVAKAVLVKTGEDGAIGPWAWKPLACIVGANILFGILIGGLPSINLPPMGLVLGVYALVFVASLASQEFRLREVFVLSTILAVAVYGICVKVLNLIVPLWPPFLIR